jgi:hypothetical protein
MRGGSSIHLLVRAQTSSLTEFRSNMAQETGLTVNDSKTKYTEITCKPNKMQYLIVSNYKFEKVN